MVVLLVLKESLKSIYGRYAAFVCALIKFFLALAVLCLLNQNLGFMKELGNPAVILGSPWLVPFFHTVPSAL